MDGVKLPSNKIQSSSNNGQTMVVSIGSPDRSTMLGLCQNLLWKKAGFKGQIQFQKQLLEAIKASGSTEGKVESSRPAKDKEAPTKSEEPGSATYRLNTVCECVPLGSG